MASASGTRDGEFGLQIAPMLDILFVLLLFFMVAASVQKQEATISTQLPGGPGGEVPVHVAIDAAGQVSVNTAATDSPTSETLPETVGRLRAIVAENPKQPVLLSPMASTRQQRVVDVLNACTTAGVKNLSFAASGD